MIFYFSGTGNSAWAAQKVAGLINDKAYDIIGLSEIPDIQGERQIGFVFPIYAYGVPEVMIHFVKKVPKTSAFTFAIGTCGGEAGLAMRLFSKYYGLDSSYSLIMPNNYIVGMDLESEDVILEKISLAGKELKNIANEILQQKHKYRVNEGTHAGIKSSFVNYGFNKFARSTKAFYAENSCNGCGLCVEQCPASAISLHAGKPVWKAQCYQCMRCINICPRQALQYGKHTSGRRRYTIREYVPQDE